MPSGRELIGTFLDRVVDPAPRLRLGVGAAVAAEAVADDLEPAESAGSRIATVAVAAIPEARRLKRNSMLRWIITLAAAAALRREPTAMRPRPRLRERGRTPTLPLLLRMTST